MLNLLNWGNTILASIGDHFAKWGYDLLNTLIDVTIGPLLWALCDIFFVVLNLFESIFRTIAGVGQVGSDEFSGDIVLYLIQSDIVRQIFMSIFILSLFLLIIFTIFAIVKNQYADKQEPVSKIINSSFKALLMYLLVPIATVVCLLVGNVVLQAVDGATKPSASMSASDMLFVTAGYNANKLRDSDLGIARAQLQTLMGMGYVEKIRDEMASIGIKKVDDVDSAERWQLDMIANWVDEGFVSDEGLSFMPNWLTGNKWNYQNVKIYYHTIQMSYITVWVGGAFLIWAIGKITWGLVARMFKMTLYYAISPAVMATFPLDNGKALGSWRGEMVKQGTMAFVAVGVMNILYTILPFINSIDAIGTIVTNGIGGMIIKLFINIIAFSSAKDLIATISGWFGTGDALSEGVKAKSQYKAAKSKLTGVATKAVGVFGGIKGGVEAADGQKKSKFLGAVTGALSQTSLGKAAFGEEFQKQVDAGKKSTKTFFTTSVNGEKRKDKLKQWEDNENRAKLRKQWDTLRDGHDFDPIYDADDDIFNSYMQRLRKDNPEEYARQMQLGKEALRLTDVGSQMYFREREKYELDKKINDQELGYAKKIETVTKAHAKSVKAEGAYKDYLYEQFGATTDEAKAALETAEGKALIKAVLAGDHGKINQMERSVSTDDPLYALMYEVVGNMTEQVVGKLNELNETSKKYGEDTTKALKDVNEELKDDQDFRSFAERKGIVAESGTFAGELRIGEGALFEDMSSLVKHMGDSTDGVMTKLKEAAKDLTAAAANIERKSQAASVRFIEGRSTDEDLRRREDYNSTHPSK